MLLLLPLCGKELRNFLVTIARSGALSSLTLGINLLRRFTPSPYPIFSKNVGAIHESPATPQI